MAKPCTLNPAPDTAECCELWDCGPKAHESLGLGSSEGGHGKENGTYCFFGSLSGEFRVRVSGF